MNPSAFDAFISYSHAADGKLAPRLQSSVARFAKPWYRRRALRIFRDETTLDVTPELWPAIEDALEKSRFFILLASPAAARSKWVQREIEHWIKLGRTKELLIVITEGCLVWNDEVKDFDWEQTNALPRGIAGEFKTEPLFLDVSWARREGLATGKDPRFQNVVARLAARIRGVPLDELIGEDIRQHAITVRIIAGAILLFLMLTGAVGAAMWRANEARLQAEEARILKRIAEERSTVNLALSHLGRGMEAEANKEIPLARLRFAQSIAANDTVTGRKKLADVWFGPRLLWERVAESTNTVYAATNRSGTLLAAKFGYNGQKLVVVNRFGGLVVFDSKSGEEQGKFAVLEHPTDLGLHPLKEHAAIGYANGAVQVVGIETGEVIQQYQFGAPISAIAYNGDGRLLAAGLEGGGLRIVDADSGELWYRSPSGQHEDTVGSIAFAPHGSEMIWSMGRYLYASDCARDYLQLIGAHDDFIQATAWSGGDSLLASAGWDGPIQLRRRHERAARVAPIILSTRKRKEPEVRELASVGTTTARLVFDPDHDRLATADGDGTARVWNARTGELLMALGGHRRPLLDLDISRDGGRMVTIAGDSRIRVWALKDVQGEPIFRGLTDADDGVSAAWGSGRIGGLAAGPRGTLLVRSWNGRVSRWDSEQGTLGEIVAGNGGIFEANSELYPSPDATSLAMPVYEQGERVAMLTGKSRVALRDSTTGKEQGEVVIPKLARMAWTHDGSHLLVGTTDGAIQEWGLDAGGTGRQIDHREGRVIAVTTAKLASTSAAMWEDGTVKVWPSPGTDPIVLEQIVSSSPADILLSPNGNVLALATRSSPGQVILWSPSVGGKVFEESLLTECFAFSPDSRWLVLGGELDGCVYVIDVEKRQTVARWRGHMREVTAVAFAGPQGTFYSVGSDQIVRRWDLEKMEAVLQYAPAGLLSLTERETGLGDLIGVPVNVPTFHGPASEGRQSLLPATVGVRARVAEAVNKVTMLIDEGELEGDEIGESLREIDTASREIQELSNSNQEDIGLARLSVAVAAVKGRLLLIDGKPLMAMEVLSEAANQASLRFDGSVIWPSLLKSHDLMIEALEEQDRPAEAAQVLLRRIRLTERAIKAGAALAPPLQDLGKLYRRAIKDLNDANRKKEVLEVNRSGVAFLSETATAAAARKDTSVQVSALEGLGYVLTDLATHLLEGDDLAGSRAALEQAVEARGKILEVVALSGAQGPADARNRWLQSKAHLTIVTFHEAMADFEKQGKDGNRDSLLERLRTIRETATDVVGEIRNLRRGGEEVTGETAEAVKALQAVAALVEEELEKSPASP